MHNFLQAPVTTFLKVQISQHSIRISTPATSYYKTAYSFYWGEGGGQQVALDLLLF
jgi:hypothetical protein